jgi:hypothetical protein
MHSIETLHLRCVPGDNALAKNPLLECHILYKSFFRVAELRDPGTSRLVILGDDFGRFPSLDTFPLTRSIALSQIERTDSMLWETILQWYRS